MRYLLTALMLFGLSSCCFFNNSCNECEESFPEDWMYEGRFRKDRPTEDLTFAVEEYAAELKHEHRLYLEDCMVCWSPDGAKIRLEFITQHILELCPARELLVDVVEGLLYRLNTNYIPEDLRPIPFTADNLELYIRFESFFGKFVDPFYIGWIALEQGISYFYAFTLENPKLDVFHTRWEPYYKSLTIVKAQRAAEKEYRMTHPEPINPLHNDLFLPPERREFFRGF